MICAGCRTENDAGRRFCKECGAPLALACSACGAANTPDSKFCGACGAALTPAASLQPKPAAASPPQAERRLVSVLFADLVGFTTASEQRDAEETRELLTRYFDVARTIIGRYGGTVEKFIGDAVMALWGAPVANEDDAERAVRAGLDLVDAVAELGVKVGAPTLRLRGGVLTGEAAVTLGAEGQGMVAGDLVNTASRIQAVAEPGTVLVGDTTLRTSQAAIVYEDAGKHALKGKTEPVQLWRALRVVANVGGEGRATGLEAPFVGRERELRMVKDLFHATADERRAHLLSVVGVPGIGKSRIAWEFEKYVDGLAEVAWWHRGRCLAYGEGVAYWALAEMVRMRARIAEDEAAVSALAKLRGSLEEMVLDPDERAFVEPRLQHLLGLTERTAPDKADLFSAWRLFIERMADQNPVILIFEDIHWADAALLEFIEYLMDWSRNHPIFVLTLSRPDVGERHAAWSAGIRSFTSLQLEPLDNADIDRLLRGLVPGLPAEALARILERADGIPLYAVETVRMLLDRGLLEPSGAGYQVAGDLAALDVPETLHALVAARLDGLDPEERRVLQDASVLGKTFPPRGLAAVSGLDDQTLRPLLDGLVRKELLYLETDPRSPERGQYGFVQALSQRVAYETLGRRDRKARHLAAAQYLTQEAGIDPEEIAEVIAAHYLDAVQADESAGDVAEIRAHARTWLERAGERAMSLAAAGDARRAFDSAAALAADAPSRARLLERAGNAARMGNEGEQAEERLAEARSLYLAAGETHAAARAAAGLAHAIRQLGRTAEAIALAEEAYASLGSDEPDEDVAALAAELGRLHYFTGEPETGLARVDEALDIAEAKVLPSVLSNAMQTKGIIVGLKHPTVQHALLRGALAVALDHDLVFEALRAYNNLAVVLDRLDRLDEVAPLVHDALELAQRRGDREWEETLKCYMLDDFRLGGRWDEALATARELDFGVPEVTKAWAVFPLAEIPLARRRIGEAGALIEQVAMPPEDTADRQWRIAHLFRKCRLAMIDNDHAHALDPAAELIELVLRFRESDTVAADSVRLLAELLRATEDTPTAEVSLDRLRDAQTFRPTRQLTAQYERLEGVVASMRGDQDAAVARFAVALAAARSLGVVPLYVAEILVDYADALVADGRAEEAAPLLAEARAFYEGVEAVRPLERIAKLEAAVPAEVST